MLDSAWTTGDNSICVGVVNRSAEVGTRLQAAARQVREGRGGQVGSRSAKGNGPRGAATTNSPLEPLAALPIACGAAPRRSVEPARAHGRGFGLEALEASFAERFSSGSSGRNLGI